MKRLEAVIRKHEQDVFGTKLFACPPKKLIHSNHHLVEGFALGRGTEHMSDPIAAVENGHQAAFGGALEKVKELALSLLVNAVRVV